MTRYLVLEVIDTTGLLYLQLCSQHNTLYSVAETAFVTAMNGYHRSCYWTVPVTEGIKWCCEWGWFYFTLCLKFTRSVHFRATPKKYKIKSFSSDSWKEFDSRGKENVEKGSLVCCLWLFMENSHKIKIHPVKIITILYSANVEGDLFCSGDPSSIRKSHSYKEKNM